jgi:hypothetical protein
VGIGTMSKIVILAVCGGGAIVGVGWFAPRSRPSVSAAALRVSAPLPPAVVASPVISPAVVEIAKVPSVASPTVESTKARERSPRVSYRHGVRAVAPVPPAGSTETGVPTGPPVAESTLSAEVTALERAQAALGARRTEAALRALDQYEATFPAGRLASEATVLRVQALLAQGDEQDASLVADRFIAAHPDSSYSRRIRDLVHGAEEHLKQK